MEEQCFLQGKNQTVKTHMHGMLRQKKKLMKHNALGRRALIYYLMGVFCFKPQASTVKY